MKPPDSLKALSWTEYAEELLPPCASSYLDYGCGAGNMLRRMSGRAERICGVDVDPVVLKTISGVETLQIVEGQPLPFPNESFDVITCLEVIEHVADERQTLRELARLLRPDGVLILTTPHKGWLTWMDPGNVKFILPGFHRFIHKCFGNEKYDTRFGEERRQELGMISDISANQKNPWHRHYHYEEIRALTDNSLQTDHVHTAYPGMRALWCFVIVWRAVFRAEPKWLEGVNRRLSHWKTKGGDQLVIRFRKV
jgi:SAM-dependent methyltransferase